MCFSCQGCYAEEVGRAAQRGSREERSVVERGGSYLTQMRDGVRVRVRVRSSTVPAPST